MVRAPHYEKKTDLKKGAWSPEEDQKLIAYIKRYGIWSWNLMPKPAGLARSGKSCRLRWVNYLRPGIKHGNISKEEEETILKFHKLLGNGWSAIAAKLPGRTDNEIKNYWHTRLKKHVKENPAKQTISETQKASNSEANHKKFSETNPFVPNALEASNLKGSRDIPLSPQLSTGDFSSSSTDPTVAINEIETIDQNIGSIETFGEFPSFWAEPFSVENLDMVEDRANFADPRYMLLTSQSWIQEQTSQFGSLEKVGELQRSWAVPVSVENLHTLDDDKATFADPEYVSLTSQMWIQEETNLFGSLETFGEELQNSWAEPVSVENLNTVQDRPTFVDSGYVSPTHQMSIQDHTTPFGSYSDTGIDFWVRLFMQAAMGEI